MRDKETKSKRQPVGVMAVIWGRGKEKQAEKKKICVVTRRRPPVIADQADLRWCGRAFQIFLDPKMDPRSGTLLRPH